MTRRACIVVALVLAGCAGTPPPEWQGNAQVALKHAVEADLAGDDRVAAAEFERARSEIARTGRVALMARAELLRCAARVAALEFGPCAGFERYRADAEPAELAYAAYLQGRVDDAQRALLPAAQQPLAGPSRGADADRAALQATADPLSRLLGAALWLQGGRAGAGVGALAVDTASQQGWRRPLLAWLLLLKAGAERAGDATEAARLARRIELVSGAAPPR